MPDPVTESSLAAVDFSEAVAATIADNISNSANKASDAVSNLNESTMQQFTAAYNSYNDIYNSVSDDVTGQVQLSASDYADTSKYLTDIITNGISSKGQLIYDPITDTYGTIAEIIDRQGSYAKTVADEIAAVVASQNATKAGNSKKETDDIVAKLSPEQSGLLDFFTNGLGKALSPITAALTAPLKPITDISEAIKLFKQVSESTNDALSVIPDISSFITASNNPQTFVQNLSYKADAYLFASIGALVGAPMGFLPCINDFYGAGMGELIRNWTKSVFTPARTGIGDLITLYIRNQITYEKLIEDAGSHGFGVEAITQMVTVARQLLSVNDLMTLWLRKEITDEYLNDRLSELAFMPDDIDRIKSLTLVMPSMGNLISMATSHAFSDSMVSKYTLSDGMPKELIEFGSKQGVSPAWVEKYWIASRHLPSLGDGFNMYQRHLIDESELTDILDMNDIPPYFHGKYKQLAYSPIPRLVLKALNKIKVISDNDLPSRCEKLGYSPDDAKLLAIYIIETNKVEQKQDKQPERDLTGSEVISSYSSYVIDYDTAVGLLSSIGYDNDEISLKMALADAKLSNIVLSKQIDLIQKRFINGWIGINDAVDSLNKLDLPPYKLAVELAELQYQFELQLSKQTKAEATAKAKADATALKAYQAEEKLNAKQQAAGTP